MKNILKIALIVFIVVFVPCILALIFSNILLVGTGLVYVVSSLQLIFLVWYFRDWIKAKS